MPRRSKQDIEQVELAMLSAVDALKEYHPITVRQLFYRLIKDGIIHNSRVEYQMVSKKTTMMRRKGILSYSVFEDRIRRPWSRIKKRAEIENLRLHDLRHTFGSWLANTGANAPIIQSALGHQNLATSEKYIHTQSDAIRKALEITQQAMLDLSKGDQKIVSINGDEK